MFFRTAFVPFALFFLFFLAWAALFLGVQPLALAPRAPAPPPTEEGTPLVGKGVLAGSKIPLATSSALVVPEGFLGIVFTDEFPWKAGIFTLPESGTPAPLLLIAVRRAQEPPSSLSLEDAALVEEMTEMRTVPLGEGALADVWADPAFYAAHFSDILRRPARGE